MKRILLDSHPSTNDYALDLLDRERPAEGTFVQTMDQTRGRGQGDERWWSEPGRNITMSMILYPTFLDPGRAFLLTQAVAVAVAQTTAESVLEAAHPGAAQDTEEQAAGFAAPPGAVRIKWPNDVLIRGRKTAGILIETRLRQARLEAAVVGVGLNVNQTAFPAQAAGATSLCLACGKGPLDLEDVLQTLVRNLADHYDELRAGADGPGAQRIASRYLGLMHGLGEHLVFDTPGGPVAGTVAGVDRDGRLLVNTQGGRTYAYVVKEITWPRT